MPGDPTFHSHRRPRSTSFRQDAWEQDTAQETNGAACMVVHKAAFQKDIALAKSWFLAAEEEDHIVEATSTSNV